MAGGHLLAASERCFPGLGREVTPDDLPDAAPADIVGYRDDPRLDVEELRRPAVILHHGQRIR